MGLGGWKEKIPASLFFPWLAYDNAQMGPFTTIWIVFFLFFGTLGCSVAIFPLQVARAIGAPRSISEKRKLRLFWRVLGGVALMGSVFELAALLTVGHVVR
jgi:hypothetical protein